MEKDFHHLSCVLSRPKEPLTFCLLLHKYRDYRMWTTWQTVVLWSPWLQEFSLGPQKMPINTQLNMGTKPTETLKSWQQTSVEKKISLLSCQIPIFLFKYIYSLNHFLIPLISDPSFLLLRFWRFWNIEVLKHFSLSRTLKRDQIFEKEVSKIWPYLGYISLIRPVCVNTF